MSRPLTAASGWRESALARLNAVVEHRRTGRWRRWVRHPAASPYNSLRMRLLNFLFSKGNVTLKPRVTTIFGDEMTVVVPSGYSDVWMYRAVVDADPEVRLTRFMLREVREGSTFFDIGSCLGYFSLLASRLAGPGGSVVAFEPSPYLSPILRANVAARGNVRVIEKVVDDRVGPVPFFIAPMPWIGTSSVFQDWQPKSTESVTAQATTLDELFTAEKLAPDMAKIDVEGAEALILRGARKLLSERSPVLILEIFTPANETDRQALKLLEELGYGAHAIEDDGSLRPLAYAEIGRYLEEVKRRYQVVHDCPNDFDNMVFKRP